jgi:hypothetical protein
VQNNYVGPDATGTRSLSSYVRDASGTLTFVSSFIGVEVTSAAFNTVGGMVAGAGNLISGNDYGVSLDSGATADVVQGNFIGTDSNGAKPLGNTSYGVVVQDASGNLIGGTVAGARNVISANPRAGVFILGHSANNSVQGNFIGTDITGTRGLGNGSGVAIDSATGNLIGGTTPGTRNVISANTYGVYVTGSGATGNRVQGNSIGTDVGGTRPLGNGRHGVEIVSGASGNLIGGAVAGAGNLISANGDSGVALLSAGGNLVQGNRIGTDVTGRFTLGNGTGLNITGGAGNVIGGGSVVAGRNLISGNLNSGIQIANPGASGTVVQGNDIGTDVSGTLPLPNGADGIVVLGGAHDNTIGAPALGNTIAFNRRSGVEVLDSGAIRTINNSIRGNSIFGNFVLGIDLNGDGPTGNDTGDPDDGPNHLQNTPELTLATAGAMTWVKVRLDSLAVWYTIDFYAGAGRRYLGTAVILANQPPMYIRLDATTFPGEVITATATDPAHNTSEFSARVTALGAGAGMASMSGAAPPGASTGAPLEALDRALDESTATGPLQWLWSDPVHRTAFRRTS